MHIAQHGRNSSFHSLLQYTKKLTEDTKNTFHGLSISTVYDSVIKLT